MLKIRCILYCLNVFLLISLTGIMMWNLLSFKLLLGFGSGIILVLRFFKRSLLLLTLVLINYRGRNLIDLWLTVSWVSLKLLLSNLTKVMVFGWWLLMNKLYLRAFGCLGTRLLLWSRMFYIIILRELFLRM